MTETVSAVTASLAGALTSVSALVGRTSLGRVVTSLDRVSNNLITGVVDPASRDLAEYRGYYHRDDTGASGPQSLVLSPQQMQVTTTSTDVRVRRIEKDVAGVMRRTCNISDTIGELPNLDSRGAVHLRIILPIEHAHRIEGFNHKSIRAGGKPIPEHCNESASSGEAAIDSIGSFGQPSPVSSMDNGGYNHTASKLLTRRWGQKRASSMFSSSFVETSSVRSSSESSHEEQSRSAADFLRAQVHLMFFNV